MAQNPFSTPKRFDRRSNYQTRELLTEQVQVARDSRVQPFLPTDPNESIRYTWINIMNVGADDVATHEPMRITSCIPAESTSGVFATDRFSLKGTKATGASDIHDVVMPIQPIYVNGIGRAAISGLVACKVHFPDANATWIRRCDMEAGQPTLVALPNGSAEILYADPTALGGTLPGTVDCIVRLGPAVDVTYSGKATAPITAGSAGPVDLYQNDAATGYTITANLNHMEQGQDISADKEVKVTWYHVEKEWRVDGAECEDTVPILGQMSDDGTIDNQTVSANVPEPIQSYDASETLVSGGITATESAAEFGLPASTQNVVWQVSISSTFLVPSNNTAARFWPYVNGVQANQPIATVQVQNATNSQTIATSAYITVPADNAPTLALWVESDSSGTISWSSNNYNIRRL